MKMTLPILIMIVAFCSNCQRYTNARESTLFQQAADIAVLVAPSLEQLKQEKNSISVQGRALTEAEAQKIDLIDSLLDRYDWFKANHQSTQRLKTQRAYLEAIQGIQKQIAELQ